VPLSFSRFWRYRYPFAGFLVCFPLWLWRFTDRRFHLSLDQLQKHGETLDN